MRTGMPPSATSEKLIAMRWSSYVSIATLGRSGPGEIRVEGDASSASYFLTAGAISGLTGGGPVRVEGAGRASIQGDVALAQVLESMGAKIEMGDHWISATATSPAGA